MGKCPPYLEKFKFKKGQKAWNYSQVAKNCEFCGKEFKAPKSHIERRRTCSTECWGKLKTKQFVDAVKDQQAKVCYRCKKLLPLDQFHKHNQKPDGLCPYCKNCHRIRNKELRRKNPEHYRKRQRDYQRKYRIGQNGKDIRGVKNKRGYPKDESCEVCKRNGKRLVYHHWDDSDFSQGMWICNRCHVAAHWLELYDPKIFYNLKAQLSK